MINARCPSAQDSQRSHMEGKTVVRAAFGVQEYNKGTIITDGKYKHKGWVTAHSQFNIAMENDPFIDGLPIKHGDFPWLC